MRLTVPNKNTPYKLVDLMNAPNAPNAALINPAAAGNVNNGDHRYAVSFVTAAGESAIGASSEVVTVTDKTVNGKVTVSNIPLGSSGTTARKLYRTAAAGSQMKLLATISDNTTKTYTDNIADANLGANAPTVDLSRVRPNYGMYPALNVGVDSAEGNTDPVYIDQSNSQISDTNYGVALRPGDSITLRGPVAQPVAAGNTWVYSTQDAARFEIMGTQI